MVILFLFFSFYCYATPSIEANSFGLGEGLGLHPACFPWKEVKLLILLTESLHEEEHVEMGGLNFDRRILIFALGSHFSLGVVFSSYLTGLARSRKASLETVRN